MKLLLLTLLLGATLSHAAQPTSGASAAQPAAAVIEGKVTETMNAAGYTYFLVETGSRKVWVAATELPLKAGDRVAVSDAMAMQNYHSKTLNRTFDVVYFSGSVIVNGKSPSPAAAPAPSAAPKVDLANIKRATGGQTVAEIYAKAAQLAGKKVAVRGRVVKYNGGILGRNWLHVRDGSGAEGTNDLTVTTQGKARVGDLIVVTGQLATNRDFGSGYKFPVMIEDATVVVE